MKKYVPCACVDSGYEPDVHMAEFDENEYICPVDNDIDLGEDVYCKYRDARLLREQIIVLKKEVSLFQLAVEKDPRFPVGKIHDCGCLGPAEGETLCPCVIQMLALKEIMENDCGN